MMFLKSLKVMTWVASIGLVSSALFIAYIVLFPLDVVTNWTISIPKGNFYVGESILINSKYTKNYAVSGKSERYIECENTNGVYIRYLINEAIANRQKSSSTGTGIPIKIPTDIAEVSLPTKCFFSIAITYDTYPRHSEPEYARTRSFILYKTQPEAKKSAPVSSYHLSNQAIQPIATKRTTGTSTPSPTAKATPKPTAKPTTQPTAKPQPTLLQQIIDPITNFVGGI